jgi:hypothetical protein
MTQQLSTPPKWLLNKPLTTLYIFEKNSIISKVYKILSDGSLRPHFTSVHALFFLSLWVSTPNLVFAKDATNDTPDNATAKSYGNGWNCNKGYRESKGACATVKVPVNAYPTNKTYGQGWECKRGFQQFNNTCKHIKVPENGYLDYSGIKVQCNRGYRLLNKTCEAIKVPANGHLEESSYGPGWKCERGYRANNKGACIALKIPENAHIGYSGKSWECDKPYFKNQNDCILPVKNW